MRVWLAIAYEPIPGLDGDCRLRRGGLLASALASRGHDVTLWTSSFDHVSKSQRSFASPSLEMPEGFRVRFLRAPEYGRNISLARVRHNIVMARAFAREACSAEPLPDVLFACMPIPELAGAAVHFARSTGTPVLVDVRDPWPDFYLTAFPKAARGLARVVLAPEFRRLKRLLRGANGITAVSQAYLDWALAYAGRDKGLTDGVFPIGYPAPVPELQTDAEAQAAHLAAEYGIRRDCPVFTFAGGFGASYDLETLIEAARVLEGRGVRDVQIVLAGNGDKDPKLRAMARGLTNVVFTGWLSQPLLQALLHLSSVGLVAYRDGAMQSLPNKPFEYMAAGLPMLSTLPGELASLIHKEEIGVQYKPGDAPALADSIQWLAANPERRLAMGSRSYRVFEERYSAEMVYRRLSEHIEGMLQRVIT